MSRWSRLWRLFTFLALVGGLIWVITDNLWKATPDGKLIFLGLIFIALAIPRPPYPIFFLVKPDQEQEDDEE